MAKMKVASHSSPAKELKMKAVLKVDASDEEDTCSGPILKRRRKTAPQPTEHSASDGRAPSQHLPLLNPSPARDIKVQKSGRESIRKGGLWDPSLDATSFLEKTLFPIEARVEMDSFREDQLVGQTTRQLGQALAASRLAFSKLMMGKASVEEEVLRVTDRVRELQMTCQETKVLFTEKSKEALGLSARNVELHVEVERLIGELAQREEELV